MNNNLWETPSDEQIAEYPYEWRVVRWVAAILLLLLAGAIVLGVMK